MFGIGAAIRQTARKTVFAGLAGLFALAGLALLTGAGYVALAAAKGPVFALVVLGLLYFAVALILLALGSGHPAPRRRQDPQDLYGPMMAAFMMGMQNGMAARGRDPAKDQG